jgi:peptidoglycan/LPS O-acetylase OafA/YrhL
MRVRGSLSIAVFFLLVGVFGVAQSLTFRYWESTVLPLATSSVILILAAVEVGKELRRRNKEEAAVETEGGKEGKHSIDIRKLGLVFGFVAAFSLAVYLLGFYIAIPLFSLAYLKWRGRSWLVAVVFAIAMLAFVYGVFVLGLKAPLFEGLVFGGR